MVTSSEQDIIDEYGQCVWLLKRFDAPHLIYASQEDLLADTIRFEWTLIDSDAMEGTYGSTYYSASPWPVLRMYADE